MEGLTVNSFYLFRKIYDMPWYDMIICQHAPPIIS